MSQPEVDTDIVNSLRTLLNYVNELGENLNEIYDRLEKIESDFDETKHVLNEAISDNKKELESFKKIMVTKTDFKDILKKLNQPFEKFTPPKTTGRPHKQRTTPQAEKEKT